MIIKLATQTRAPTRVFRFPPGTVMTIAFQLAGQKMTALNGGPVYKFTEAISFVAACDDQAEIDRY
ncbi:MAG: VOC family protein [Phycisphaerales bacterium]